MKNEAEALRLALICGSVSLQEVAEWAVAQIEATAVPEPALVDLVAASDRTADVVSLLARIPGRPEARAVASSLARRLLASVQRDPARAENIADHVEQIVRSGEWPEAVSIDIYRITDGFALARQGVWTYDQALSNLKILLAEISKE